jgi:hypothetical protein
MQFIFSIYNFIMQTPAYITISVVEAVASIHDAVAQE